MFDDRYKVKRRQNEAFRQNNSGCGIQYFPYPNNVILNERNEMTKLLSYNGTRHLVLTKIQNNIHSL